MKAIYNLLIVVLLSLIPTTSQAQNNIKNDSIMQDQNNIQSDTLKFTIYGMDCPGCEGGLEKQVYKIPAIKFSKADWVNQELRIVLVQDSTLNTKELEKRVKKANFTLETNAKNEKE